MVHQSDPHQDAGAVLAWTPPEGMLPKVASEWRAFYRAALVRYDVTPKRYLQLYLLQRGRCWICRKATGKHPLDPKGRGGRRLGIDHNHTTGVVRGLLCSGGDKTCNRIIGWLDAPALRRAAAYLDGSATPNIVLAQGNEYDEAWAKAVLWGDMVKTPVPVVPGD